MRALPGWNAALTAACLLAAVPGTAAAVPAASPVVTGVSTGILYDRVMPLSRPERLDGSPTAERGDLARFWQVLYEMRRASLVPPGWPDRSELMNGARGELARGVIPIALVDLRYQRLRPEAAARWPAARPPAGDLAGSLVEGRVFAAAALRERTYRGAEVAFALDPERIVTNRNASLTGLEIDPGDGAGFRPAALGAPLRARYAAAGEKTVRVRASFGDGAVRTADFAFRVMALATPLPDDTLHVTAAVPYRGVAGTGDAYVRLAPGHASVTNPVVVIEGFDIDNSMNWDELYALLDQQNLADSLRALGYDEVVLNFTDATDYVQRNSFVVAELIQQVGAGLAPGQTMAVVGASMGGLCSRYALAWLESQAIPHRVRTFISLDGPHRGADIPLGIQYWTQFFSSQSADALYLLDRLNTPAARQMLVYHLTNPPSPTGTADSLRAVLNSDLAAIGDFPTLERRVAIANGSGQAVGQGFAPAAQIIRYEYSVPLITTIRGDVWAVPDQSSVKIFDGLIHVIFQTDRSLAVTVSGTQPYDNAPGGSRATMTQMDTTSVPYGDIVALYPSHCFIPTVSALDLDVSNLFYDVAGDPDRLTHTPFDAVYFPAANQEHVEITSENAGWLLSEIQRPAVGVPAAPPPAGPAIGLAQNVPNPCVGSTTLRFHLARAGEADLVVHDLSGRRVATLAHGAFGSGMHAVVWNARDANGRPVAPGIYFCALRAAGAEVTRKLIVAR